MVFIRQATKDDLERIIQLDKQIFGVYGGDEDPKIIFERLRVFPEGCIVLVLKHKTNLEVIVGYLTCEKWSQLREPILDENPRDSHDVNGNIINVTTLAIDPEFQNQGLGSMTLDWLYKFCLIQSCDTIILETAKARTFYQRKGFIIIGERSQRGFPLYIMKKYLNK